MNDTPTQSAPEAVSLTASAAKRIQQQLARRGSGLGLTRVERLPASADGAYDDRDVEEDQRQQDRRKIVDPGVGVHDDCGHASSTGA